ncbi:MAG: hypothetical protein ACJASL_003861 [Paraglaciecola sp.]
MTDYESAILALESAQGVREQIALMQTQAELLREGWSIAFTCISGYIIVAHYVASKLSRIQVAVLNFLYASVMTFTGLGMYTAHNGGVKLAAKLLEIIPGSTAEPYWSQGVTLFLIGFLVLCMFASVMFFYESRRNMPNDEVP